VVGDGRRFESRKEQSLFSPKAIQTGFGDNRAHYSKGYRGSLPRVKGPEREVDHLSPSSVEVNN
jgi:hypothetical protein